MLTRKGAGEVDLADGRGAERAEGGDLSEHGVEGRGLGSGHVWGC